MAFDELRLEQVQRWLQAVITHPAGVLPGLRSPPALDAIEVGPEELEQVVRPSRALSSVERLEIYSRAYYTRLVECLANEYPIVKKTVGDEAFEEFAFGYLTAYPSRSYTLGRLGTQFARYLEETRPAGTEAHGDSWSDFLVDLAHLEWTFGDVFDGPGLEQEPTLSVERLRAIEPARWGDVVLPPAPCLRLLALRYPANLFYGQARQGDVPLLPKPRRSYVAVTRVSYVVQRHDLSLPQYLLLTQLAKCRPLGDALAATIDECKIDPAELSGSLPEWFAAWTRDRFFSDVQLANARG